MSWARALALSARAEDVDLPRLLRPAFVVAEIASVFFTWSLWQARTTPPLLPAVDWIPQVDMALILVATAALALFKPEAGVLAHAAVLMLAFAMDQTRMQPEFISLTLVIAGTTRIPYARTVAMAHLVTLWLWAGLNKALSLDFMHENAASLYQSFPIHPESLRVPFGWAIIVTEISIGLLLLVPSTRRAGVIVAVGLHVLGLLTLVRAGGNSAVWPWNAALAVAAVAFFWPRSKPVLERRTVAVFAAFALFPIAFYAGYLDAYLAHNLYTSNTPTGGVCFGDGACSAGPWSATWSQLNVPLPAEPRLFRAYFEEVCEPGQRLIVFPRQTRVQIGRFTEPATYSCPS
jgi:hypothetical protein